jgi:coenzyme F420-reducing hydrogenase beta subunit
VKQLIEHIDSKQWTDEYIEKAVGQHRRAIFCHAADPAVRRSAASAGVVSAILIHLLDTGEIDGALVVSDWMDGDAFQCGYRIAHTREEILAARGSKYMPVYFNRDAAPQIERYSGRLAAVLLPCDAQALARLRTSQSEIDEKIAFVITLFCGHNSERALTDAVIDRFRPPGACLRNFRHREGHWRGTLRIGYDTGDDVVAPFSEFSTYQNLFFFAQKKCHACFDHFGFYCDLATGDIWSQKMKRDPVKKNAVLIRSALADRLVSTMIEQGVLNAEDVDVREVCDGQSRALPFHYNLTARSRVGALFGMRLKDTTRSEVRWNDILAAFLVMLNERVTRNAFGRRLVLSLPKPLLKAYLVFLKGLESL